MKILGIILGVMGLAIGIAWFALVRAPSPEDVCSHIESVLKTEGLPGALVEKTLDGCVERHQMGEDEGLLPYAEKMKCRMGAESIAAIDACR